MDTHKSHTRTHTHTCECKLCAHAFAKHCKMYDLWFLRRGCAMARASSSLGARVNGDLQLCVWQPRVQFTINRGIHFFFVFCENVCQRFRSRSAHARADRFNLSTPHLATRNCDDLSACAALCVWHNWISDLIFPPRSTASAPPRASLVLIICCMPCALVPPDTHA